MYNIILYNNCSNKIQIKGDLQVNRHEYFYTNLNWVRNRLDKENIAYEINSKEKTIIITTPLGKSIINKIIEGGI